MTTMWISDAPPIEGLVWRGWRPGADDDAIADLLNRCTETDRIPMRWTAATVASELGYLAGFDPERDLVLGEDDGRIVALARTNRVIEYDGVVSLRSHCFVDPSIRDRGIGRALLRHQEARLRSVTLVADPPEARRVYRSFVTDHEPSARALLESEGYRHIRTAFRMEAPLTVELPTPPALPGLEIRPIERREIGHRVLVAANEAFRDHPGHHESTEDDYAEMLDDPERDFSLWQVAWDGGEVAGMVVPIVRAGENALLGRRIGWLDAVGTRRPWRKRGVATALMARSLVALRDIGMTSAGLGVDSENPTGALGLYERLGFVVVFRWLNYQKPLDLT